MGDSANLGGWDRSLPVPLPKGMVAIEKWQIKTIYTLANGLGLVDKNLQTDILHEMIYSITKKEHVTDLSKLEAGIIIDRLKGNMKGFKYKKVPDVDGMVSKGQESKIWALIYELKKYDTPDRADIPLQKRLTGFLKKYAGIDNLRFLSYQNANKVIEGLKGLIRTEQKKAR